MAKEETELPTPEASTAIYAARWKAGNDSDAMRAASASGLYALLAILYKYAGLLSQLLAGANFQQLPLLLSALAKYHAITTDIRTRQGVKERVSVILEIVLAWTAVTPGTQDDQIITTLKDWLENRPEVIDLIATTIAALIAKKSPPMPGVVMLQAVTDERLAGAAADGIVVNSALLSGNWLQIIQVVWTIWQIFHGSPAAK